MSKAKAKAKRVSLDEFREALRTLKVDGVIKTNLYCRGMGNRVTKDRPLTFDGFTLTFDGKPIGCVMRADGGLVYSLMSWIDINVLLPKEFKNWYVGLHETPKELINALHESLEGSLETLCNYHMNLYHNSYSEITDHNDQCKLLGRTDLMITEISENELKEHNQILNLINETDEAINSNQWNAFRMINGQLQGDLYKALLCLDHPFND